MIWTTGYRSDYSWMHIPGVVRDVHPVHRRGVTNIPGLYFLGLPWQHSRGSALLGFVRQDAAYLAGRITGRAPPGSPQPGPLLKSPACRALFVQAEAVLIAGDGASARLGELLDRGQAEAPG